MWLFWFHFKKEKSNAESLGNLLKISCPANSRADMSSRQFDSLDDVVFEVVSYLPRKCSGQDSLTIKQGNSKVKWQKYLCSYLCSIEL